MPASKVTITPTFVKIAEQPTEKTFVDVAKSDWFADAVANGIVNGSNGKLNPQNNATRAEVAAILMRFCEMSK